MFFATAQLTRPLTLVHFTSCFHSVRVLEKRHVTRSAALELLKLIDGSGALVEGLVLCGLVVRTTWSAREVLRDLRMTDMQQIFAGMKVERECKTLKPEQLKQSDKVRRHCRNSYDRKMSEDKGRVHQCHYNRSSGSARLRRSISLSRSKARMTCGESVLEFFATGLDDLLVC